MEPSESRFRTLAVKPVPLSTTNHEEKKKKPLLLSRVKHKRAQVSVACITCRNAKAKCNGTAPCTRCIRQNIECSFAVKRNTWGSLKDQAAKHREALTSLHEALKSDNPSALSNVQQAARQARSLQAFLDAVPIVSAPVEPSEQTASSQESPETTGSDAFRDLVFRIRTAEDSDLASLIGRLKACQDDEDAARIIQQDQQRSQGLWPHENMPEKLVPSTEESEAWFPLLQTSNAVTPAIKGNEKDRFEYYLEQGPTDARRQARADLSSYLEEQWRKGNYPYPYPYHESTGTVEEFGNLPFSYAVKANNYPPAVQQQQLLNFTAHEHQIRPFSDAALQMISSGMPISAVLGDPNNVNVELFFRDRRPGDPFDVYAWAAEINRQIEDFDPFVLLATCILWSAFMRWTLLPTPENYALLPAMIRPTPRQRFIPHSVTIGFVPHPAIREALVRRYRDWLSPGTAAKGNGGTSIDWPYSMSSAVEVNPVTGRRQVTRAFIEHATNPKNRSAHKSIRPMYPEIEEMGFRLRN